MPDTMPNQGRLAGIDYGGRRIGIAVCDRERMLASPYESYERRNDAQDAERFRRLVADESITGFVVGLPVHASGDESESSQAVRHFAAWLRKTTALPVCFFDERFTSQQADALMRGTRLSRIQRKKRRDMIAAQIILAAYLESPAAAEIANAPLDEQRE